MTPHRASTRAPKEKKLIQGILEVTRKGVGYMAWEGHDDIEVGPEYMGGALRSDTVHIEVLGLFPRPKGKVVKVESRARTAFVCTITYTGNTWIGIPDDQRFYRPIILQGKVGDITPGTKAVIKLLHFDGTKDPTGEILEIIGTAGEHRTEMNAIVLEHGFRVAFPPEVTAEAEKIERDHANIIAAEVPRRADFRDVPTFTIDPLDAKDFDDALSVRALEGGEYEIGIHIADATFFVRPGTALDDEATRRGTSVYLVDATIPMLPHELSGNVCSLKQGEDRLAFSAVFRMNKVGDVLDRRFEKSIINSNQRFTYEQAQDVLTNQEGPYLEELNTLSSLARIMRKKRDHEGAIDFGDNEVRFVLDESGKPIDVVRKVRIETNLLIEEFMLLANREVAKYVTQLAEKVPEHGLVFLYRIHDEPKEERIEDLATFVRAIGYEFGRSEKKVAGKPTKHKYSARDISKLLQQIEGKPEEHLIRTATLRTMAKAIYSTKNIGHFGLAFEFYTHFTSPIRRYPDMLVHRILASHIDGHPINRREFGNLERMCLNASEQEAKAVSAERDSIKYKQVEYLSSRLGQEFDAVISGVTEWGLYVEDVVSGSEGLVRVRSIGDDFYTFKQKEYSLIGDRTKKKFTLGDKVRVRLVAADIISRTADFELA